MPIYEIILKLLWESKLILLLYWVLPVGLVLKRQYEYNLSTLYFFLLKYHEEHKSPRILKIIKILFYYFRLLRFLFNTACVFVAITIVPLAFSYVYLLLTFVYDGHTPWAFVQDFNENFLKFFLVDHWWIVKIFLKIFFLGVLIAFYCYMKTLNFEYTKKDIRISFFTGTEYSPRSWKLTVCLVLMSLFFLILLCLLLYYSFFCLIGKGYFFLYIEKSCVYMMYLLLFLSKKFYTFSCLLITSYKLMLLLFIILRVYISMYIRYYSGNYLKSIYTQGFIITVIRYSFFYINIWDMLIFYYLYFERKYFMYIQTYIDRSTSYDQEFKTGTCFTKKPKYDKAQLKAFMYTEEDYKKYIYLLFVKLCIRQLYFIIYIIKHFILYIIKYNFIIYIRMFHFHLFVNYIKLLIFTLWSSNLYIYFDYMRKELYVVFNNALVTDTFSLGRFLGLFYKKSIQYYNYNYVSTRVLKRSQFQEWFLGWYDISKHIPKNEKALKIECLWLQQFYFYVKVWFTSFINSVPNIVMWTYIRIQSLLNFFVNFYTGSIITKWVCNISHFFFHMVGVIVINCLNFFFFIFFKLISLLFKVHIWVIVLGLYVSYFIFDMNNVGISSVHYLVTTGINPDFLFVYLYSWCFFCYDYVVQGVLDSVYQFRPEYLIEYDTKFEYLCKRLYVQTKWRYIKKYWVIMLSTYSDLLQANFWLYLQSVETSTFSIQIDWARLHWLSRTVLQVMWEKGPFLTIVGMIKYERMCPSFNEQFEVIDVYWTLVRTWFNKFYYLHTRWLFSRVTSQLPNVAYYKDLKIYGGYIIFIGRALQKSVLCIVLLKIKVSYYFGLVYLWFLNSNFYLTFILPSYINYVYLITDPHWNVERLSIKGYRVSFFTSQFWSSVINQKIFDLYNQNELTETFIVNVNFDILLEELSQMITLFNRLIQFYHGIFWSLTYLQSVKLHYSMLVDFWTDVYLKGQEYFDWITYYCRINYFNLYSWVTEASYEEVKEGTYDEVAHGSRRIIKRRRYRHSWTRYLRYLGVRTFIARGAARVEANNFKFRFVRESVWPLEPFELFYGKSKGLVEYCYETYAMTPIFNHIITFWMRNQTKPKIFGIREQFQTLNTYKILIGLMLYDYGDPLKDYQSSMHGWYIRHDYNKFLTEFFFQFSKFGIFMHMYVYLFVRGVHFCIRTKNCWADECSKNPEYWWESFRTNYNYNLLTRASYTKKLNNYTLEEMKEKLWREKAGFIYNPEKHLLNQEKSIYIRLFKNIHLKPLNFVYAGFDRLVIWWGVTYYNMPKRLNVQEYFNSTIDSTLCWRSFYAKAFTKLHGRNEQQQEIPIVGSFGFTNYIPRYFQHQSIIRNLEKLAENLYINYWLQVESYFNLVAEVPEIFAKFQVTSLKNCWQMSALWNGSDYYDEDYTPLEEQLVDPGFSIKFAEIENAFMLKIYNYFKELDFYIFNNNGPNWLCHKDVGSMFANYDVRASYVIVDDEDLPLSGEYVVLFAPLFFYMTSYLAVQLLIRPDWGDTEAPIVWNLGWFTNFYKFLILQNIKPLNWICLQFERLYFKIDPPWVPRSLSAPTTSAKVGWHEAFILDIPFIHQHDSLFWLMESQAHSEMVASKGNLYFINHTFFQEGNKKIYLILSSCFFGLYICYWFHVNLEYYFGDKFCNKKRSVELQFLSTVIKFTSLKFKSLTWYVRKSTSSTKGK